MDVFEAAAKSMLAVASRNSCCLHYGRCIARPFLKLCLLDGLVDGLLLQAGEQEHLVSLGWHVDGCLVMKFVLKALSA